MTHNLDINTQRGRESARDQQRAADIVFSRSDSSFFATSDHGPAKIDGVVCKDEFITALVEIKSRDVTREKLMGVFHGEWLVSMDKLKDMAQLSSLLAVPGYGLLYLIPSYQVLVVKLTDFEGNIVCTYREEVTETPRTCNGGSATRNNAFINMVHARIYHENPTSL